MKKFLVAWMVEHPAKTENSKETYTDHYQPFIEEDENERSPEEQAFLFYKELLQNENVYSANICEIKQSTDYTIDQETIN